METLYNYSTFNSPLITPKFSKHFNFVILRIHELEILNSLRITNTKAVKEESQGSHWNSLTLTVAPHQFVQRGGFLHIKVHFLTILPHHPEFDVLAASHFGVTLFLEVTSPAKAVKRGKR